MAVIPRIPFAPSNVDPVILQSLFYSNKPRFATMKRGIRKFNGHNIFGGVRHASRGIALCVQRGRTIRRAGLRAIAQRPPGAAKHRFRTYHLCGLFYIVPTENPCYNRPVKSRNADANIPECQARGAGVPFIGRGASHTPRRSGARRECPLNASERHRAAFPSERHSRRIIHGQV